jgi:hypothetical protein
LAFSFFFVSFFLLQGGKSPATKNRQQKLP